MQTIGTQDLCGRRILIVEDEPLMLRLLEKFFARRGYEVLAASDGQQAIEIYQDNHPQIDVVLLDFRLPKSTGERVFQSFKAANAGVKVVIATGFIEPEKRTELIFAGVKRFVNKPYVLDELLEVLQSVIDHD